MIDPGKVIYLQINIFVNVTYIEANVKDRLNSNDLLLKLIW